MVMKNKKYNLKSVTQTLFIMLLTIMMAIFISPQIGFAAESYLWPSDSQSTSRGYGNGHVGVDITSNNGSDVYATKSGTVFYVYSGCRNTNAASSSGKSCSSSTCSPNTGNFWNNGSGRNVCNWGYGNGVVIKHSDGSGYSMYAHLSSVSVSKGANVSQGSVIGKMGSSGNSTGTHLHFELSGGGAMSGTYFSPTNSINNNTSNISYIYNTGLGSMSINNPGTKYSDEDITITWTTASNAAKYGLTVRNSSNQDVFDQFVTGNSKNIGKLSAGTYKILMAPYNSAGKIGTVVNTTFTVITRPTDTTKPVISDIQIIDKTSDGYTVQCKATDNTGVTKVLFPTWTDKNDQDDLDKGWPNTNTVAPLSA